MGEFAKALATAEAAFEIPGVREKPQIIVKKQKPSSIPFSNKDRCNIYLLLAKSYGANKRFKEAKEIMNKAISEFNGTPEQVNVMIANSEIAIQSNDIKKAISILKAVDAKNPYFQQSRILLADIFLTHLIDRRQFARCYTDLVDANPSIENYKLLGNALLRIFEPEDAAAAFEKALQINPDDEEVVRLLGNALCKTHDYEKAFKYYEIALAKNNSRIDLVLDLSALCIQIKNFQRAEELLNPTLLNQEMSTQKVDSLKKCVQGYQLIAKLHMKKIGQNDPKSNENIRKALKASISVQKELIEKVKAQGGEVEVERQFLSELLIDLAKYLTNYERNDEAALQTLEEAKNYKKDSEAVLMLQTEIYMKMGDKVNSENNCNMLLKLNPNNEFASVTYAELLLQKEEQSQAIEQFKKILEDRPNNYGILAKLIDFFR